MSYIDDINKLPSITFDNLVNVAVNNLVPEKRVAPWLGLAHGVKLLETEEELNKYLCAYGQMHKQKIMLALEAIVNTSEFANKGITIIDWGCGQALATICFFDYVYGLGIKPKVEKIILIEPSKPAIERAKLHVSKFVPPEKIVVCNKFINDIKQEDITTRKGVVLNFYSNILDIESVNLEHLAKIIVDAIPAEQLHFCVGPQNVGASRITQFAKLFNISEEELVKAYRGHLVGRGTVNLLVFKLKSRNVEIVKVEYLHRQRKTLGNSVTLQHILKDIKPSSDLTTNALLFYKLTIELERFKSTNAEDNYFLPLHFEEGKFNVDVQEHSEFENVFRRNSNPLNTRWPKHLNIGIGIKIEDKIYRLLQYIYPYEEIKDIDITQQFVSVPLSDFELAPNVADELEIGDEMQKSIELLLKDKATSLSDLENILKDAIHNDAVIDEFIQLALTSEAPALSQINSELNKLLESPLNLSSLLDCFLKGNLPDNHLEDVNPDTLIQVVDMDESQRRAISTAIGSKISVITGPPGTGKTQMILNLIVNLMMRDKSVLIASKVNKAIDNIKERFDAIDSNQYLLRYGSKEIVQQQVVPYLETMIEKVRNICYDENNLSKLITKYNTACKLVEEGRKLLLELVTLRETFPNYAIKLTTLSNEKEATITSYTEAIEKHENSFKDVATLCSDQSVDWKRQKVFVQQQLNTIQRKYSGIWKLFFSKKKYAEVILNNQLTLPLAFSSLVEDKTGINSVNDVKNGNHLIELCNQSLSLINRAIEYTNVKALIQKSHADTMQRLELQIESCTNEQKKTEERISLLTQQQPQIENDLKDGKEVIKSLGKEILKNKIEQCLHSGNTVLTIANYKSYLPDRIPWQNNQMPAYERDASNFLEVFRLNAVTNLSVKNAYPLKKELVDVVIIDEASQCDVASALPLIQRAKQVVIIGDPLQLRHISSINPDEEMAIRDALDLSDNPLVRYANMSLFDYCQFVVSTASTNSKPTILEGHYRCHPEIIGYSNEFFYERKLGTRLQVYTRERNPNLITKGIVWEDVRGEQKSDNQNVNEAEVKRCLQIAEKILRNNPDIEVGIISPFKHQAQEINAKIVHLKEQYGNRIVADTVYKFQGDECDVIIYSLVVTDNSPETKIRWIDYSCPNLVNVAVTRARSALYVVGNREYIKRMSNQTLPLGFLVDYTERKATVNTDNQIKTYIVDTNVFVDCPDITNVISPQDRIVIPSKVVDELDKLKVTLNDENKRKVEKALRTLNSLIDTNRIRMENADILYLPNDFRKNNADNMILSIALKFKNHNAILLTSDNGLQLKAKGLGVKVISPKKLLK